MLVVLVVLLLLLPVCAEACHPTAVPRDELLLPAEQIKVLDCAATAAQQQLRVCEGEGTHTATLQEECRRSTCVMGMMMMLLVSSCSTAGVAGHLCKQNWRRPAD